MQRAVSFGPYLLVERIGVGARSEVFRARRRTVDGDEVVALKRALSGAAKDRETEVALFREAELLSRLEHPGVVRVSDFGTMAGLPFVAYELVDGVDLEKLLSAARDKAVTLPLDAALTIALRVTEALEYLHSFRGLDSDGSPIIHRDVGPSNVLIGFRGAVKLADFGIAKVPGRSSTTGVGEIKGTIRYMSPEQVRGDTLDARSDLYGLGAVLLEMASGRVPFDRLRPVEILQVLAKGEGLDPDAAAPGLPETMRILLRKVLAPNPSERYDTTAKLHEALRGLVATLGVQTGEDAVMRAVDSLFPARAAQAKTFEESHSMADEKGGSDLDVFEGLAKKSVRPSNLSIPASNPPTSGRVSGLPAPVPPPPSLRSGGGKATLLGVPVPALPPPSAGATPLPVPSKPSVKTMQGMAVPPPSMPPNLPPPSLPKGASAPPAPPPMSSAAAKLPSTPPSLKPPNTLVAAVPPPPKPPASIGAAVGLPSSRNPGAGEDDREEKTPPVGVAAKKGDSASLDMDWEDEEESTHVFEKKKHGMTRGGPRPAAGPPLSTPLPPPASRVGQAATLLMASGASAAPRSVPPPQSPPASLAKTLANQPVVSAPAPVAAVASTAAPASYRKPSEEPTIVRTREGSSGKVGAILGGLALIAVVGLAVYMLLPRQGDLKITVKSKTGEPVAKAEIYVDGKKHCDTTPCLVSSLDAGSRAVRVIIDDQVVDQIARVEPGREEPVTITVDGAPSDKAIASTTSPSASASSTASAVQGTGISVSGPKGVKVFVDGKERGELGTSTLTLADLQPGERTIKLDGGDQYKTVEKKITVEKDKVEDLGQHKPVVVKGLLTVDLKTKDAEIVLTGVRDGKKFEKKLQANQLDKPLSIPTDEEWKLTATKNGHEDFSEDLEFEDGEAERTLAIELVEKGKSAPPAPTNVATAPPSTATAVKTATTATATAPSGSGTLSMNSNPISNVILDGVPIGKTPIGGRSVSAGRHTVTFRHAEKGSKSVTVTVKPGGKAVAAVKFD